MKRFALSMGIALLFAAAVSAQEYHHMTFDFGTGFTTPVNVSADHLDTGWNIQGGVGANFNPWIGAKVQVGYDSMGINRRTLFNIGFPGGNVHVFSATLDPIIHFNPHSPVGFYAIGGTGLYRRTQEFTAPTITTVTGFDPFFGLFYPVGIPTNQVLASYTVNKIGINAGGGFEFGPRRRGKIFAEARWTRIFLTSNIHTDYVPVTFGFRW
ncbi:MAG TPA: outer membrane beta-barrel protein [Bryobacteraceae bacterium]|jgi:opacity protein-like surface antigen